MSLIIKGMEMPQAGDMIICGQIEGKLQCTIVTRNKPTKWCEVSEVSTPHGRLIDADRLYETIEQMEGFGTIDNENDVVLSAVEVLTAIDEAPTIIEAEVK